MRDPAKEVNGRTRESEKIRLIRENPSGYFAEYRRLKFGFAVDESKAKKKRE